MQDAPIPHSSGEQTAEAADLAHRRQTADDAPVRRSVTIGDLARGLGDYARISGYAGRPMTEHEHRLAWERETRR